MHNSLKDKLKRIVDAPVRFSKKEECFVVEGRRKHGVTKFLAALMPVPRSKKLDFIAPAPIVAHIEKFRGALMAKCGCCRSAITARSAIGDEFAERLRAEPNIDKAHGMVVDHQLSLYVRQGRERFFTANQVVDPCVGTLLEQLDKNGWTLVASQLAIFDAESDVATAIDLLATDRETGRKLMLIEVKASRPGRGDDENYERIRGVLKRSTLHNLPQSFHARHQLQLIFMHRALERNLQITPDASVVMRVSPGTVRTYQMAAEFVARSADIMEAIGAYLKRKKQPKRKRKPAKKKTPVEK